mgnify:CR=1 FL=1
MKSIQQISLRVPTDLVERLAARTPSRKRNQFVVDLIRRELEREGRELEAAAQRLSALETLDPAEESAWLAMEEEGAWGEFDEKRFLAELRTPRHKTSKTPRSGAS